MCIRDRADAEASAGGSGDALPTSYSSGGADTAAPMEGTLASDEALAALREKLTGN